MSQVEPGDAADNLTDSLQEARAAHARGECSRGCLWCVNSEPDYCTDCGCPLDEDEDETCEDCIRSQEDMAP